MLIYLNGYYLTIIRWHLQLNFHGGGIRCWKYKCIPFQASVKILNKRRCQIILLNNTFILLFYPLISLTNVIDLHSIGSIRYKSSIRDCQCSKVVVNVVVNLFYFEDGCI